MYIKTDTTWRSIVNAFLNVAGTWKQVTSGFINVAGTWKQFFLGGSLSPLSTVEISQSTNGSTGLVTLTGTNYYWSPGPPALTYKFQWYNGTSFANISTGNAVNPSYGTLTSYTQLLYSIGPPLYVQPNQLNRFRFQVNATYGGQSATSTSGETTIQGPTNITLSTGSPTTTSIPLSWNPSTGANRYMVYRSTNNSTFTLIAGTSSTFTTATGLSANTLYYFKVMPITGTTNDTGYYGNFSNTVSEYTLGTPIPIGYSPSITGSTTVGNNAFGNIGSWTNSPTLYDYRWFFVFSTTSYPLTFSQSRSVSNKYLNGFDAALVTSSNHGYKTNDIFIVSNMDSLFNGSHTITAVTSNTIYLTLPTPAAWANAGTGYSSGTFVSYFGNAYAASTTISSVSPYNGSTLYSTGAIVYSGNNRYQSNLSNNIGRSVNDVIYWNPLGNFAPGGPRWTLQSFSNTVTSGTTTGPNYYEGSVGSSTSISLSVPLTDYRSGLNLIGKALYFAVKAYNPGTTSPSEYNDYKIIYGVPSISLGASTVTSNSISIPFTSSNMTSYIINVSISGSSISGYPQIVSSPSSPILISSLSSNQSYLVSVTPRNGEDFQGAIANTSATTLIPVSISGISLSDTTIAPSSATSVSVGNSGTINVGSSTWANGANTTFANLYSVSGAGSGGANADPTSLLTSGTFTIDSTGTANVIIRAINTTKRINVSWTQSGAQSYLINTTISGAGTTFSGNSSISNPSILVLSDTSSRVVTVNSITVYSGLNQTGSSVTLSSSASLTSANATTNTSGSGSVTRTVSAPVNTVLPVIAPTSGTAGSTTYSVTSVGSWTNSPTGYAYLWQSSDNPPTNSVFISAPGSNTSSSYTPPANFFTLGYSSPIRCRVIASNSGGNSSAAFSNNASVSASVVAPSGGTVSISTNTGNYNVGSIITYSTTGWSGSPTSYSLRLYNGTNPVLTSDPLRASTSGTSGTYTIVSADVPNFFKAFATASNSAGTSNEASSTQVGPAVSAATVPGTVNSLTASSLLSGSNLNWSASWSAPSSNGGSDITGYRIYVERAGSSSGPWIATTTQSPAGTGAFTQASPRLVSSATTSVTGRVTGTAATWIRVWVAAVNAIGTGTYTSAIG